MAIEQVSQPLEMSPCHRLAAARCRICMKPLRIVAAREFEDLLLGHAATPGGEHHSRLELGEFHHTALHMAVTHCITIQFVPAAASLVSAVPSLCRRPVFVQPALMVFDLDGTLIDSAPDMHRAVNLMLADLGCPPALAARNQNDGRRWCIGADCARVGSAPVRDSRPGHRARTISPSTTRRIQRHSPRPFPACPKPSSACRRSA